MSRYDDIINLPRHVSKIRKPMSMENRAAQFAPFAALTGHDAAIVETARLTTEKPELSLDELDKLSRRLNYAIEKDIIIRITFFQPDVFKQGGLYQQVTGNVRKIDEIENVIILMDQRSIRLDYIISIE
ncbi:MAG: YolD-like family protein, partial [Muribaculaceae bacterium]|nr:YolD-like family protein [Muribaculaceae bacterium]